MLEALRQVVQRREAGSDHIFELIDMGLSERDEREAIQVYRWVEGQTLAGREGAYAADIVIELGAKLARGLRLLHRNNILHRDICPRNVVLDDVSDSSTLRPVLIDFGFARLVTAPMHTAMAGDHIAPEVRGPNPEWSRAADVYALGSTLLSVLAADDQAPDLRRLLSRVTAERTDERPSAEELLAKFEELEIDRKVNERRDEAWRELWSLAGEHRHIPWFSAQMNKMRESLVNVALGFYRIPAQRYGVIADFLNQLTESNPVLHNSLWGLGMRTGGPGGDILKTLGALRNQHVHGRGNQSDDQRILVQRFQALPPPEQRREFCRGTDSVASIAQLKGLPAIALKLLG
jgi:serine/threonine protein kinase